MIGIGLLVALLVVVSLLTVFTGDTSARDNLVCDWCEEETEDLIDGLCTECRQPKETWHVGHFGVTETER